MIALDSADAGVFNVASSNSWNHTCNGDNRILWTYVTSWDSGQGTTYPSVTYNSVSMTPVAQIQTPNNSNRWTYLYYLVNPDTGTHPIVESSGIGQLLMSGSGVSYTGAKQSSQPDNSTTNSVGSGNTSLTTSLVTNKDNCWIVMGAGAKDVTINSSTGDTFRSQPVNVAPQGDSNGLIHPAGSYSMTVTTSGGSPISMIMASFLPAPILGGSSLLFFMP